jgi:hypothetical protein
MLTPNKVKQKLFFHIKLALILNEHPTRYRFLPGETNKILGGLLHPFLQLEGEMEKVWRDINKYFFFILRRSSRRY